MLFKCLSLHIKMNADKMDIYIDEKMHFLNILILLKLFALSIYTLIILDRIYKLLNVRTNLIHVDETGKTIHKQDFLRWASF